MGVRGELRAWEWETQNYNPSRTIAEAEEDDAGTRCSPTDEVSLPLLLTPRHNSS